MTDSAPAQTSGGSRPSGELDAIGGKLFAALNVMRIWCLSLHDEHGDVLWLNDGVMGPDEHEAVRTALEVFAGEGAPSRHDYDLGDGRVAVTLRAGEPDRSVLGVVMIVVDSKVLATRITQRSGDPFAALSELVIEFTKWLSDDVSATQTRLRALPALTAIELALEPDDSPAAAAADDSAPRPGEETAAARASQPGPSVTGTHTKLVRPATRPPVGDVDPELDRLFNALRAQPILLYAQQLEPLAEGSRIRRLEILLRTTSEHGRTKAPVAMLEGAVKRGLGSVIDRRVITELLTWLARNPDTWRAHPLVASVNLSPNALNDDHLIKFLELCLAKAALPRGMIGFELDATLAGNQLARTTTLAELLAALGCTLILDDFSTGDGHAALLSLKGLRMLKVDAALTKDIGLDKRRQAIVAGIAQTARVLGMHTCAKHIESKQDQRWLAALKMDFAQGYAFSQPRPLAEIARPHPS
ncbi:MAG: EAL domain-containing protein [Steroidobacteraceae bacterium]